MQLEQNSKQIAQEKQDYIDKLNDAASKLESELEKKQVSYCIRQNVRGQKLSQFSQFFT